MAWVKLLRKDCGMGSRKPFIAICPGYVINFSAHFARIALIEPGDQVIINIEDGERKLGFEFFKPDNDKPESFTLTSLSRCKKGKRPQGVCCTPKSALGKYPWVTAIANLPNLHDRRFVAHKSGNLWVIQLMPAFEIHVSRQSGHIPSDIQGIYRYVHENGDVVYIGRGAIAKRLKSAERKNWEFDAIEYSIVSDFDKQQEFEAYWLKKYQEDNNGNLPLYNKVSASGRHRSKRAPKLP